MTRGDTRLWRKLGLTQPLISVWSEEDESFAMNDDEIKSITIKRGSSVFGEQEHTMEVNTNASRGSRTGHPLHCDLTAYGAQVLNDWTGADAATIKPRYFGRIGRQSIDDLGGIWDPTKWHTSVYCSKWQSQLANSDRVGNQISGNNVMYLFEHFMNPKYSGLDYLPPAEYPVPDGNYGVMINDYDLGEAKIPYSEFATKYFDDPGFYVRNTRAGADRVETLEYRWIGANTRLETWIPLTRSQCLAPTMWDQPNEDRPANHRTYWQDSNGQRTVITGPDVNDVRIPLIEHDISHIRFYDDYQPIHRGYVAYGAQRSDSGYQLPDVTIDLLQLITSPSSVDRQQARQLLYMEMGDPVMLAGDWYVNMEGINFATGITEKISPDGWEITLSLTPSMPTIGRWSPDVEARTWESAHHTWDNAPGPWDR